MSADAISDDDTIVPHIDAQGRAPESPDEWVPEFEGQRPPLQKGNEAAVKSGAGSQKQARNLGRDISPNIARQHHCVFSRTRFAQERTPRSGLLPEQSGSR